MQLPPLAHVFLQWCDAMKSIHALRSLIREMLNEIDIEDVSDFKQVAGSTHIMNTGMISDEYHYIKFSDDELFEDCDPSLQPLVEYLAYSIYRLYPGIRIPRNIDLVFDASENRVGIATSAVGGQMGLRTLDPKTLGRKMSAGVYVDVFLANWDVVGTDSGNVIIDDAAKEAYRIDPGGSLSFRAQGGKKGRHFTGAAGELDTMLDPDFGGAGQHFQFADLETAAKTFLSVEWEAISQVIAETDQYVTHELEQHEMLDLLDEWKTELRDISSKLQERWSVVSQNASAMVV